MKYGCGVIMVMVRAARDLHQYDHHPLHRCPIGCCVGCSVGLLGHCEGQKAVADAAINAI